MKINKLVLKKPEGFAPEVERSFVIKENYRGE